MTRADGQYFSPVYFRGESEPYLSLGLRGQSRDKGVTIAEVNLKFVWDVISRINVGRAGRAFVVDSNGLLIAHFDISLLLRNTDLSASPQVVAARAASGPGGTGELGFITEGLGRHQVLSSHAVIAPLGWLVFIESPLSEAFAPLYRSLIRTVIMVAAGIVLSVLIRVIAGAPHRAADPGTATRRRTHCGRRAQSSHRCQDRGRTRGGGRGFQRDDGAAS